MFRKKGFTLLELIIVIIIIGILATLALPRFLKVTEQARAAEGRSILGALRNAQLRYYAIHSGYTTELARLDTEITGFQYFNLSSIGTSESNLANVTRNDKDAGMYNYSLVIDINGTIHCDPQSSDKKCPEDF